MKYILLGALLVILANGDEVPDCKCSPGTEAKQTPEGPKCLGIRTKIILPCNLPKIPTCLCTGDATASVNSVKEGSYCVQNEDGKEVKRWDCENAEEWEEYNKNKDNQ